MVFKEDEMREKKYAYPVILKITDDGFYYVIIPDFNTGTQGQTIPEAIAMARDAIGLMGIDYEDDGIELPEPNTVEFKTEENDIVTLVDVDFVAYRKKVENRAVKKNCTIPYWMSEAADKAGVNYSRLLQEAIINFLGISKAN